MIPIRPTPRLLAALMVCLLAIGLWQLGEGSWIYAKARLAQWLLMRAWSRTLAGEVAPKPWPWADTWPVARLTVPSKQVDLIVLNGAYARILAFGPGYWEGSPLSDSIGTTILTGHRDTHFAFLKTLRTGDHIMLQTRTGHPRSYRVRDLQVVDFRTAILWFNPDDNALILVTCYPFDRLIPGGPLRYVVIAEAVYNGNERHDGRHQAQSARDLDAKRAFNYSHGN
ncbi:MAG TPA: class GN sortase [Nitrospiraceae bacterium]